MSNPISCAGENNLRLPLPIELGKAAGEVRDIAAIAALFFRNDLLRFMGVES